MNRLTRFLDWLDEAAAGFIRLAYLLAGITAVALYFGAKFAAQQTREEAPMSDQQAVQ